MLAVVIRAQRIIIPLRSPAVTRKPREKKGASMESNEQGGRIPMAPRRAHTSPWSRSALDEKGDTWDTTEESAEMRGGGGEEERKDDGGGERQMQVQPAPVQDGRMDVRADEGGIELWQRLLQGAGSGPGEADILLILYFFVCAAPP